MAIQKQRSNIGYQYAALKQSKIAKGEGKLFPSYFYWECDIKPTEIARVYKVLIFYGSDFVPRAFVLSPNLKEIAKDQVIPHLYSQDRAHLCLYYPPGGEWNASMSIVNDFVPWIYMWLMFFEQWLVTGEWHGGGIHFTSNTPVSTEMHSATRRKAKKKKSAVIPFREKAYKIYDKRLKNSQRGQNNE